ncbi:hypothetical protein GW17_00000623 [Ensete ventricosum]|nr:hypothetical protein GW17_00000623 [Ensete ventricosum]
MRATIADKDEGYHALCMTDLQPRDPDAHMETHWTMLKNSSQVWLDRATLAEYERGVLFPLLDPDLYASPSEVLNEQVAKSLVLAGSMPEAIMTIKQHRHWLPSRQDT